MQREREAQAEIQRQEEKERLQLAFDKMMAEEKEKAERRHLKEQEMRAQREKSEPAFKQKKVLGRIQHIFQKKISQDQVGTLDHRHLPKEIIKILKIRRLELKFDNRNTEHAKSLMPTQIATKAS